ncbi:MAG: class I SAM-dependent methyltransferase [Bacteroidota bacterium]
MSVITQGQQFPTISQKELAGQIEAKKKSEHKLPTWFNTAQIYYPEKLSIEQTSSEKTAGYKADLVQGKMMLDMTGGFGVDTYFFSSKFSVVHHCERNSELSEIAQHNHSILKGGEVVFHAEDALAILKNSTQPWDWIYLDPARRKDHVGKVFLFQDCEPNVPEILPLLFEKAENILIKAAPLLDITRAKNDLEHLKEIHIVAVRNEVKEVLYVLQKGYEGSVNYKTINLRQIQNESFDFNLTEETNTVSQFELPETYLYEPNRAILKSGAFKSIGNAYGLKKLHEHTHLYTANEWIDFPGRRFLILSQEPFKPKVLKKKLSKTKANVIAKNFTWTVAHIRKRLGILDGGETYLFFTKTMNEELTMLVCERI